MLRKKTVLELKVKGWEWGCLRLLEIIGANAFFCVQAEALIFVYLVTTQHTGSSTWEKMDSKHSKEQFWEG